MKKLQANYRVKGKFLFLHFSFLHLKKDSKSYVHFSPLSKPTDTAKGGGIKNKGIPGIEPGTTRSADEYSTTELYPLLIFSNILASFKLRTSETKDSRIDDAM